MNRDEHITYINNRLIDLLKEVVCTANHLGNGMEANIVNGYLLQSLFLQMTGAQEQKMKCICWELATDDLVYRYKRYYDGWSLSQCSTLKDKSHVYEDLLAAIHKVDQSYELFHDNPAKQTFINNVFSSVCGIFDHSNIIIFHKKKYSEFKTFFTHLNVSNLTPSNKHLFKNGDKDFPISKVNDETEMFAVYSLLYKLRNRCAHNTPSYQLNLPSLKELRDSKYQKYDNIFIFYTTLVIIDEIFRKLFAKYQTLNVMA